MLMKVICRSRPTLLHGVARSHSGDHAVAAVPRLYSRCTVRQGQDNRMLHKAPQVLLHSLTALYTHTPGELGHQVTHTVLTTPDTLTFVALGIHNGQKPQLASR